MSENFKIDGLREVYALLDDLSAIEKRKILLGAMKKTANRHIKKNLESANIHKSSKSRKSKPFVTVNNPKNKLGILSGVSSKFFHYRFIEFGTKQRYTKAFKTKTTYLLGKKVKSKKKKKSAYRGVMRARPFMKKIIDDNLDNVIDYFASDFGMEVKKRLDRLAKKKK